MLWDSNTVSRSINRECSNFWVLQGCGHTFEVGNLLTKQLYFVLFNLIWRKWCDESIYISIYIYIHVLLVNRSPFQQWLWLTWGSSHTGTMVPGCSKFWVHQLISAAATFAFVRVFSTIQPSWTHVNATIIKHEYVGI